MKTQKQSWVIMVRVGGKHRGRHTVLASLTDWTDESDPVSTPFDEPERPLGREVEKWGVEKRDTLEREREREFLLCRQPWKEENAPGPCVIG